MPHSLKSLAALVQSEAMILLLEIFTMKAKTIRSTACLRQGLDDEAALLP